jgi:hypothetical protein
MPSPFSISPTNSRHSHPISSAVNPIEQMSHEQPERHALEILSRELGPHGLARFLRACRSGSGDYTSDRNRWLQETSVQDLARNAGSPHVS